MLAAKSFAPTSDLAALRDWFAILAQARGAGNEFKNYANQARVHHCSSGSGATRAAPQGRAGFGGPAALQAGCGRGANEHKAALPRRRFAALLRSAAHAARALLRLLCTLRLLRPQELAARMVTDEAQFRRRPKNLVVHFRRVACLGAVGVGVPAWGRRDEEAARPPFYSALQTCAAYITVLHYKTVLPNLAAGHGHFPDGSRPMAAGPCGAAQFPASWRGGPPPAGGARTWPRSAASAAPCRGPAPAGPARPPSPTPPSPSSAPSEAPPWQGPCRRPCTRCAVTQGRPCRPVGKAAPLPGG